MFSRLLIGNTECGPEPVIVWRKGDRLFVFRNDVADLIWWKFSLRDKGETPMRERIVRCHRDGHTSDVEVALAWTKVLRERIAEVPVDDEVRPDGRDDQEHDHQNADYRLACC